MKAMVTDGPLTLACKDVAAPEPRGGEVCLSFEKGLFTAGTRRAILGRAAQVVDRGFTYPLTIGGAALATVEDAGGSERVKQGDRVYVSNVITCGRCAFCTSGHDNICIDRLLAGIHVDGTFAELFRVDERRVFPVADDVDTGLVMLVTEIAVMTNALHMGWESTEKRDRVAIIGAGNVGMHGVTLARLWGATEVHVIDTDSVRLEVARRLGAAQAMTPDTYDAWVAEDLAGRGAGVAIVATDDSHAIALASRGLRARGCLVCVGLPEGDKALLPRYYPSFLAKELVLRGCYAKSSAHIAETLELLRQFEPVADEAVEIPMTEEGAERLVALAQSRPDGRRYVVTHEA